MRGSFPVSCQRAEPQETTTVAHVEDGTQRDPAATNPAASSASALEKAPEYSARFTQAGREASGGCERPLKVEG